jgi:LacI family transcriptional regulator
MHIANAAMRRGYHVIEASAETARSRESDELVRFLRARGVDGVILDSPETSNEVQRLIDRGLPVVQVIRPRTDVQTPSISVDSVPGIEAALHHLTELGHRHVGFIGHGGMHPTDRSRLDCFTTTLEAFGSIVHGEWIVLVDDYAIEHGYTAARRLLALDALPTALFVAGDNLALGVLQALHESDIRVPDALSMVTYDDIFAAHLAPPLTSVVQPLETVGEEAIALLTSQVEATTAYDVSEHIILPTSLTVRSSTRFPSGGKEVMYRSNT